MSKRSRMTTALFALVAFIGAATGIIAPLPANAAIVVRQATCVASDSGYRAIITVQVNESLPYVTTNIVTSTFQHRTLGVWNDKDWATTHTNDMVVGGNTVQIHTDNPPKSHNWLPTKHGYLTGWISIKNAASGGGRSFSGCSVYL